MALGRLHVLDRFTRVSMHAIKVSSIKALSALLLPQRPVINLVSMPTPLAGGPGQNQVKEEIKEDPKIKAFADDRSIQGSPEHHARLQAQDQLPGATPTSPISSGYPSEIDDDRFKGWKKEDFKAKCKKLDDEIKEEGIKLYEAQTHHDAKVKHLTIKLSRVERTRSRLLRARQASTIGRGDHSASSGHAPASTRAASGATRSISKIPQKPVPPAVEDQRPLPAPIQQPQEIQEAPPPPQGPSPAENQEEPPPPPPLDPPPVQAEDLGRRVQGHHVHPDRLQGMFDQAALAVATPIPVDQVPKSKAAGSAAHKVWISWLGGPFSKR